MLITFLLNACVFSESGEFQPSRAGVGAGIGAVRGVGETGSLGMALVGACFGALMGPPQEKQNWDLSRQHNPSFSDSL